LLPLTAYSYTVILLSGRRIEIPAQFTVTKLTLTYETTPGINITLLMDTIDIRATERANQEPEGSLLRRTEAQKPINNASTRTRGPRRELTKERERSGQEYERRRLELGLPSLEEVRRRNEEEMDRLRATALQSRAEEGQAEAYWRTRSSQLRTEIAALGSQISYVRARLSEMPENSVVGTYGFVTGVAPGVPWRRPVTRFPTVTGHPGFMRGNNTSVQGAGFLAFGGSTQVQLSAGRRLGGFGRRGSPGFIVPGVPTFGVPYANYDYAGERANLIFRLHELETARVGLQARWRALEEEARRAGAQPGWLRP
jgi:hypothetical protein